MSLTRSLITAVVVEKRPVRHVAAQYGLSRSSLYALLARYRTEGEAVFEANPRRPKATPNAIPLETVDLIVRLRKELSDAGPDTIGWHLTHHHGIDVGRTTITRYLTARGLVVPEPKKRPRSSYTRFAAPQPNECWQADFTHYRLTKLDGRPGRDTEILSWLDDHSRYALSVTAHHRVTGPIVLAETIAEHGIPAATLTDNGISRAAGLNQTYGVKADGATRCWGDNAFGETGTAITPPDHGADSGRHYHLLVPDDRRVGIQPRAQNERHRVVPGQQRCRPARLQRQHRHHHPEPGPVLAGSG